MKIIDRYILKSHLVPFVFAFITILFVLILQFFTIFAERFIGKGIDVSFIFKLILLQSAWMVGFAAPMAVLIAVVFTFSTLTTTSEITVLKASGISLYRLMVPLLIAGCILSLIVERFSNVVLPQANYFAQSMMIDLAKTKPTFGLTQNAFSSIVDGYSIFIRDSDERTKQIRGVVIYDNKNPDTSVMVTAENGSIMFSADSHYLIMTLYNGEIHEIKSKDPASYSTLQFSKNRFVTEADGFSLTRSTANRLRSGDNELSANELIFISSELKKRIADSENAVRLMSQNRQKLLAENGKDEYGSAMKGLPEGSTATLASADKLNEMINAEMKLIEENRKTYNRYMAAFHKKYSLSFACLVFVLVGAPLGVLARKGGFGLGALFSMILFVLYWALMITGEKIAERGLLDPMISMWLGNIIIILTGVLLLVRLNGTVLKMSR